MSFFEYLSKRATINEVYGCTKSTYLSVFRTMLIGLRVDNVISRQSSRGCDDGEWFSITYNTVRSNLSTATLRKRILASAMSTKPYIRKGHMLIASFRKIADAVHVSIEMVPEEIDNSGTDVANNLRYVISGSLFENNRELFNNNLHGVLAQCGVTSLDEYFLRLFEHLRSPKYR